MSILTAAAVTALGKILLKAGAPMLKRILEKEVGGTASEAGSVVIDAIGAALGVAPTPDAIVAKHEAEPVVVESVIHDVEVSRDWTTYLLLATAGRDRLIEREDTKGFFHNGWRPAMSWLVIFLFAWSMVAVPLANATLGGAIAAPSTNDILQFAGIWLVVYGRGHTGKSVWGAK